VQLFDHVHNKVEVEHPAGGLAVTIALLLLGPREGLHENIRVKTSPLNLEVVVALLLLGPGIGLHWYNRVKTNNFFSYRVGLRGIN
jgi:hypothetical protein